MQLVRTTAALILGTCLMVVCGTGALAAEDNYSTSPTAHNGKKWRIGYYEGGPHGNYYDYLSSVVSGLMELNWIEKQPLPQSATKSTESLWAWLSTNAKSDYIEFPRSAYYSADWDPTRRARTKSDVVKKLVAGDQIDLMIAMGTWAGQDLSTDEHSTPTVVMSTSDPIAAGIVTAVDDSGREHVHARVDPKRYERQVRMFHDIIGFKTLGVAYEDTVEGRSYAAMDMVERVAKERGFQIVRCHTKSDIADRDAANSSVTSCFKQLARDADAVYVTTQGGVNANTIPELVKIAHEKRIPTFSQSGSREVEYGFLLSISRPSFRPVGLFLAATVAKIMNGAKPRELRQLFEEAPNIAINLKTAEVIGLYLYADVLAASDELYHEIAKPK